MKRRMLLTLIALTALLLISCNLVSRFTGKAQGSAIETAQAAAQVDDKTPTPQPAATPTSAPKTGASQSETPEGEETITRPTDESVPTPIPPPAAEEGGDKLEAPQEEAGFVEWVSPDYLESYRANWLTRIKMPGQDDVMGMQYRLEWTKEPAAQHMWVDMGMSPFAEAIWIEDQVWVKVGENWVKPQDQAAEQVFDNFHEAWDMDDDMVLAGEEAVNGVHSKHYVYDFAAPAQGITIHREVWVADEGDLPKVPVRAILRMENKTSQGTMITEIEANLADINTPIEIKPPM